MQSPKPIQIGVRAVVPYQDGIIMVEHQEKDHGNFYVLPGGGAEPGESLFQATERELNEETNIEATAEKIVYIRETEYKGNFGLEIYILCKNPKGDALLGHDPDKPQDKQVLKNIKIVSLEELSNQQLCWYPEELHEILLQDVQEHFCEVRYLGLSKIT